MKELRKELGLPEDQRVPDVGGLNVRDAVEGAVAQHAAQPGQEKGYFKAEGLHQANILWGNFKNNYLSEKRKNQN